MPKRAEKDKGEPIVVYSEARGCDVIIGYRGVWDREKARSEKQQTERDASRKPLTPDEQVVYTRTSREWLLADDLGDEDILERLIEKYWLIKTWYIGPIPEGSGEERAPCAHAGWIYQRVHSLDGE